MNIDDLVLKKEEIPIRIGGKDSTGLRSIFFQVPIHPEILKAELNPRLARNAFRVAAINWYDDLAKFVEGSDNPEYCARMKPFLKKRPSLFQKSEGQVFTVMGGWRDWIQTDENGFVTCMMIERNLGGSLYLNDDLEYLFPRSNNFSSQKLREYGVETFRGSSGVKAHIYSRHNVDHYAGALFLRDWAVAYLNAALRSLPSIVRSEPMHIVG